MYKDFKAPYCNLADPEGWGASEVFVEDMALAEESILDVLSERFGGCPVVIHHMRYDQLRLGWHITSMTIGERR